MYIIRRVQTYYFQCSVLVIKIHISASLFHIFYGGRSGKFQKKNRQLRNKLDNLDGQSRRNNVIVQGIPESEGNETWAECEEAVKNCLQQDMGLDEDIRIERAHRLPKPYAMRDKGYPRDIIVKLSF